MNRFIALARNAHRLQSVRFVAFGVLNTLFGYMMYLAGLALGLAPEAALALATATGALFNYLTTARYVFGHRTMNRLPVFVAAYAVIYGVNASAIQWLLKAGMAPALAQACLVPPMAASSFMLFRRVVFRPVQPR